MPELIVRTNVAKSAIGSKITEELTQLIFELLGKPKKYICVVIIPDVWMTFGGTSEPCASCVLSSVEQFDAESNRKFAKIIMDYLGNALGVATDRMYLNFNRLSREFTGFNSDTFYGIFKQSK